MNKRADWIRKTEPTAGWRVDFVGLTAVAGIFQRMAKAKTTVNSACELLAPKKQQQPKKNTATSKTKLSE
jgi:hypothetical protein